MTKKAVDIIGILVGVLMIVFAIIVYTSTPTYSNYTTSGNTNAEKIEYSTHTEFESDKRYGGDAYTGIQQAAAQAANNTIAVIAVQTPKNTSQLLALFGFIKFCVLCITLL